MAKHLYHTVFEEIIKRIADGTYPPGSMLPSEFDLGDELKVSQGTARKALIALEQKGIIERRQGRGTFVALRTPESSLFHFFRLRHADGSQVLPELAEQIVTRRAAAHEERELLFGAPEEVFEVAMVRAHEGQPLSLEHSVVPVALFPGLQERAPLPNTLYVLFQQAYSCVVIRAEENIQATLLGKERGAKLGLDPQTPVIIGKRRAYDLLERRIELRTCVYITGDTTYSVNMD